MTSTSGSFFRSFLRRLGSRTHLINKLIKATEQILPGIRIKRKKYDQKFKDRMKKELEEIVGPRIKTHSKKNQSNKRDS